MNQDCLRAFSLPRSSQQGSPLLQLPAELRLEILRILLKKNGRLPAWEHIFSWEGHDDEEYPALDLSPQILLSCQALYRDAYQVLYEENMLSICFSRASRVDDELHIGILDADLTIFNTFRVGFGRFEIDIAIYDLTCYNHEGPRDLTDTLHIAERFTNVHISFRRDASYLIASRAFKTLLHNKCVIAKLEPSSLTGYYYSHWLSGQPHKPHLSLACFAVWQCQSIKFQNGCRGSCCLNEYTNLVELITNEKVRVRDLFADLWRLNSALAQDFVMSMQLGLPLGLFEDHKRSLMYSIYNSDVRSFNRQRQQVMVEVDSALSRHEIITRGWMERSALAEILEVEEHFGLNEEERSIWIDYILSKKEHDIAVVRKQVEDTRRLLHELVDEDELLSDRPHALPGGIITLDRVSSLPQEVFMRSHTWQAS